MAEHLPEVPAFLSLEGRAQLISDETGRSEHAGDLAKRRDHVRLHALAHLRAMLAQAKGDT